MLLEIHVREFEENLDYIEDNFPSPHKVVSRDQERNSITFDVLRVEDDQQKQIDEWFTQSLISKVREMIGRAPQAQEPQPSLIDTILATPVHQVPSNGNNRFYMEPEVDKRWDRRHHLIDLNGNSGLMYSSLSIAEFSSGVENSQVQHVHLTYNEVDELLAILVQWRMSHEEKRIEDAKPENALGDLNEHPF